MRYNWDSDSLKSAGAKLAKLIKNTTDEREKAQLRTYYDALNNFYFAYYTGITSPTPFSAQDKMIDIGNGFTGYSRYYSLVQKFYLSGKDIEKRIYKLDDIINNAILSKKMKPIDYKYISHDKTLSLVKSFYQQFDPGIYELFMNIYNNRGHIFRFDDPKGYMGHNSDSTGDCLFVGGVNRNFITVQNNYGVKKVTDSIHECGHAMANLSNPLTSVDEAENFFCEVESLFPELVAMFTNFGHFDDLEICMMNYDCLTTYYNSSKNLTLHESIFAIWEDLDYKADANFMNEIYKKHKITKKQFRDIVSTSITFDGIYVLSYAVALELYHMYKTNKKQAIELYKEIVNIPIGVNRLGVINSLVNIGEHSKECFEEVEHNLKLALRNRGLKI